MIYIFYRMSWLLSPNSNMGFILAFSTSLTYTGACVLVQVVIVDDGSADGTNRVAFDFVKKYTIDNVRVILLGRNYGKGEAIRQVSLLAYLFFSQLQIFSYSMMGLFFSIMCDNNLLKHFTSVKALENRGCFIHVVNYFWCWMLMGQPRLLT